MDGEVRGNSRSRSAKNNRTVAPRKLMRALGIKPSRMRRVYDDQGKLRPGKTPDDELCITPGCKGEYCAKGYCQVCYVKFC